MFKKIVKPFYLNLLRILLANYLQ